MARCGAPGGGRGGNDRWGDDGMGNDSGLGEDNSDVLHSRGCDGWRRLAWREVGADNDCFNLV
jgi:hypothetical protein